jgi:hypothetical protein
MTTEIRISAALASQSNFPINAFMLARGYTVSGRVFSDSWFITLVQDLTDVEKNELTRELVEELGTVDTDVSQLGESDATAKKRYMRVMDRCALAVIDRGFVFTTELMEMDTDAEARATRYNVLRTSVAYPVMIPNAENSGEITLNNTAANDTFYQAMNDALFPIEQDNATEKGLVFAAVTKAAARGIAEAYLIANNCAFLVPSLGL